MPVIVRKVGMRFKARDGKVHSLTQRPYFSERKQQFIFQTQWGWFYPRNIYMWCNEVGEGSKVITPDGTEAEVIYIFPNGTVEGGRSVACSNGKSYREFDLRVLEF